MPVWKPEVYQGARRKRRYFEGWYFKQVSRDLAESWSFIPGISRGERAGSGYSFVQAIEGSTGASWWFEYPLEAFVASTRRLEVAVGPNRFSLEGLELDLPGPEGGGPPGGITASLRFVSPRGLPRRVLAPGVMGPFAFVPFMECRHGLVSIDHGLEGSASAGGRSLDFTGGRGYAEKDWGSSMPRSWIWTQSNNFAAEGDSLMLSLARVPWLGSAFNGFLLVASLGGRRLLEATWTGARLASLELDETRVALRVERRGRVIEVEARRARGGLLRAPVKGELSRRIAESVDARLRVAWTEGGKLLYEGEAGKAGLEIVGDAASLAPRRGA